MECSDETISGEMTKLQQRSAMVALWFLWLFFMGILFWSVFFSELRPIGASPTTGVKIAAIAVVCLVGSGVLVYLYGDAKRDIAEFACDKNSFRFRKLGTARSETRALAEVATVGERRDKSGLPIGCRVVFQDGTEAFLEYAMLPNARALSDRLRSHVPGDWRR